MPSRLTSSINHLYSIDILAFYLSPESVVNFLSKLYILPLLRKVSKLVFKTIHLSSGQAKLGETNNFAGITFSKIDSLSVKIEAGRENCYKFQYVIELAHLVKFHVFSIFFPTTLDEQL